MARRDAVFASGEIYHVFNRGCNRCCIFREPENYHYLLRLLGEAARRFEVTVISYCLMPNHFHFLLRQNSNRPISDAMQQTFNRYVKAFNKRFGRTGTLFEERFKAKAVDSEEYFAHLCRYIHRNPVDAGLVGTPAEWTHSDFLDWIGKRTPTLSKGFRQSPYFTSPSEYDRFVMDFEAAGELEARLREYTLE
jgi:REP element-mobilizing transposase RayT